MSTSKLAKGQCLCGAIEVTVAERSNEVGACHCGMCRRWVGGPLMSVDCGSEVTLSGQENLGVYASSDWAERGFCNKCGSALFYRFKQNNQYIMPAGLFNDVESLEFDHQIYIDHKPSYYDFANQTQTMTEAEVIALYAPKSDD